MEVEVDDVRDWVGDQPDDPTIYAAIDRTGDAQTAALVILRRRLTDMLANPASWSTNGDYAEGWAANIAPLERRIADLEKRVGTVAVPIVTTGQIDRQDNTRFPRFGW